MYAHGITQTATGRDRREDGLPENHNYFDTGCELAPHCLTCPLPQCKYDSGRTTARKASQGERDRELADAYLNGATVAELCERYGLSRRSVFRIVNDVEGEKRREPSERGRRVKAKATHPILPDWLRRSDPLDEAVAIVAGSREAQRRLLAVLKG